VQGSSPLLMFWKLSEIQIADVRVLWHESNLLREIQ